MSVPEKDIVEETEAFLPRLKSALVKMPRHFPFTFLGDRFVEFIKERSEHLHVPAHSQAYLVVATFQHMPHWAVGILLLGGAAVAEICFTEATEEVFRRIHHVSKKTHHHAKMTARRATFKLFPALAAVGLVSHAMAQTPMDPSKPPQYVQATMKRRKAKKATKPTQQKPRPSDFRNDGWGI